MLSLYLFCLMNQGRTKGEVGRPQTSESPPPPVILLLAVPRGLFCFGYLDVVCRYLSLFLLYINIEIGKIDDNY